MMTDITTVSRDRLTKDRLLGMLRALREGKDHEHIHSVADTLLILFIHDPEIEAAYDELVKWYA